MVLEKNEEETFGFEIQVRALECMGSEVILVHHVPDPNLKNIQKYLN